MRNVKKRTTFKRQPKVPGNTPPPIHYTNKNAQKWLVKNILKGLKTRG